MERLKKIKVYFIYISILCVLIACFSGCNTRPPAVGQIEKQFLEYESDFCTVVDYLTSIPTELVYISTDSVKNCVGLTNQQVDDPLFLDSIQHLRKAGCSSIYMNRSNNSISFVLWKTEMIGDAEAGILYALDKGKSKQPTTQYLTELQFLKTTSWYYYVADYEEWRSTRQSD